MENNPVNYYWLNSDKYDMKSDKDLKYIKDQIIYGQKISENENDSTIDLNIVVNKKMLIKNFKKEDLIELKNNISLCQQNLSNLESFTSYEVIYNILNNYNKGKYFNFLTDEILLTYTKFPITNISENYFENYLLIQDYQKNLFENPEASHKTFEHLKENIMKILTDHNSNIKNENEVIEYNYDEVYLKLIQKILDKEKNSEIKFISNTQYGYSTDWEEMKFLIQNFSVYNKHRVFREKELKSNFESEYKIYDMIYEGIKILEIFGCGTGMNNLKSDNIKIPKFNFKLILNLDKDLNQCKSAKFEITNFNREAFDLYLSERSFDIFHILPKYLSKNYQKEFILDSNTANYKLLKNSIGSVINEQKVDEENFILLFNYLLKNFKFQHTDVNLIIQLISLILNLSNLEFINKNGEINVIGLENVRKVLKIECSDEVISKLFTYSELSKKPYSTIESCQFNLNTLIKDIYESIFYFVVEKINIQLGLSLNKIYENVNENLKEIIISNSTFYNKKEINNPHDLFRFFSFEKSIKYFDEEKIDEFLEKLSEYNKIEYVYDKNNKSTLNMLDKIINIISSSRHETMTDFYENTSQNQKYLSIYNFDIDHKINLSIINNYNLLSKNKILEFLLDQYESSLKNSLTSSYDPKITKDIETKLLILKSMFYNNKGIGNSDRNLIKELMTNYQNESRMVEYKFYIVNFSDCFSKDSDMIILKNELLKNLKKLKIKSYIENILSKFSHYFTKKYFIDRFFIPCEPNSGINPKKENFYKEALFMILSKLERNSYQIKSEFIFLSNSAYLRLKKVEDEYLVSLKQHKRIFKTIAVIRGFVTRLKLKQLRRQKESNRVRNFDVKKYVNDILDKIKPLKLEMNFIIDEKPEKVMIYNNSFGIHDNKLVTPQKITTSESKKKNDFSDGIRKIEEIREREKEKEIERDSLISKEKSQSEKEIKISPIENSHTSDFNNRPNLQSNAEPTRNVRQNRPIQHVQAFQPEPEQKLPIKTLIPNQPIQNKNIVIIPNHASEIGPENYNFINYPEDLVQQQVQKIQAAWKSKRESNIINTLREKVFIIQRNFRKYLIKKYDLPENYFYNEKFFRVQQEKYERNLLENMRVLFPAVFNEELKQTLNVDNNPNMRNSIKQTENSMNKGRRGSGTKLPQTGPSNLLSNNLSHSAYEEGKIHLFSKILDIDLMVETDEIYESLWAKSFDKVYSQSIKNNNPVQLIALGNAHTVCLNNKGRLYSFGWNNFGQCGVPLNSTILAKYELESEYLVEMTEYNELKPKVLNKVDGIKQPQIEEIITARNIACGEDHTLILDDKGSIWAFGLNLSGQLGLGHRNVVEKPSKIKSLNKHFITGIKSEGDINFAMSDKGEAFMWPWSDKYGNLNAEPIKLPLSNLSEKVTSISCGHNFVLLLNQSGMVYSMGRTNTYGQLGHGDSNPRYRPTLIEFFAINNERISQISCGYKHCVAKSVIGHAFTWGLVK
jgi:hypothetical protein